MDIWLLQPVLAREVRATVLDGWARLLAPLVFAAAWLLLGAALFFTLVLSKGAG